MYCNNNTKLLKNKTYIFIQSELNRGRNDPAVPCRPYCKGYEIKYSRIAGRQYVRSILMVAI